jgi:limonene-1,2-epoxide hydrolase
MNLFPRVLSRRRFAVGSLTAMMLGLTRAAVAQVAAPFGRSIPPDVEKANVAVVARFCAAFARTDVVTAASLLADGCVYRTSQTRPPLVGKTQVAATITRFIDLGAEFNVTRTVALGPVVLNERDDIVVMQPGEAPRTFHFAAGMFFVENGRIAEWNDYVIR